MTEKELAELQEKVEELEERVRQLENRAINWEDPIDYDSTDNDDEDDL